MAFRVRTLTVAAACACGVVTILGSAVGRLSLGARSPSGHVAIDTATGVLAVLAGYLVFARFVRRGDLAEVVLVAGLVLAAVAALAFGAIPAAAHAAVTRFTTWSTVTASLVAAVLFATAGFVQRRLTNARRAIVSLGAFCAGALAVIGIVMAALAPHVALGINPELSPNAPGHPRVVGNTTMLVATLITAVLYAAAAVGFARRSISERDELFSWFAVSSTILAFAALNDFLFASSYSSWLFVGDWLTLAAYLMLLIAAAREIAAYQRGIAAAAVLEERRRLARELHDGLAQELAFITTQSRRLIGSSDQRRLEQLALAAERALDESRSAIRALTRRLDEPLEVALAQAAEEVAERVGIDVRLDLEPGIAVPTATREALLRIVREAVSNTARHSRASQVTVTLSNREAVRLLIVDDGVGFDPAADSDSLGFGLVSMRERAYAFGGDLTIHSEPGHGTQIEVVIP